MSPAYLLIDTNLWYRLVGVDGTGDFLKQLHFSAKKKEWIFLCPETIYLEWQEHKKEKEKRIKRETNHNSYDGNKVNLCL